MTGDQFVKQFSLTFEPNLCRRIMCDTEVVVHCHHYNSRIQRTIEGAAAIDGKALFVSSAERVFAGMFQNLWDPGVSQADRLDIIGELYAHLGYGRLEFSHWEQNVITATESHFVEGWAAGFPDRSTPVCSLTEGYLQAAIHAITGESVRIQEETCMISGAELCRFSIHRDRSDAVVPLELTKGAQPTATPGPFRSSPNVDEQAIIDALVDMPIHGGTDGLISAFNLYLANTPADFYNVVCIRFVEEMEKVNLGTAARSQLVHDAETCGMHTFRGIIASPEWEASVGPMIKQDGDTLYGIIAVSNALGWGNWHVLEHTPSESLQLQSMNGYEACGYLAHRGVAKQPVCHMLTGVAAGIMELVYGEGLARERFGQFQSFEQTCRCCERPSCTFIVAET